MNDAVIAWLCYWVSAAFLLLVVWRLTAGIRSVDVRAVLLLIAAALLLTPARLQAGSPDWVPALMAMGMDTLSYGIDTALPRLWLMLLILSGLLLSYALLRRFVFRRPPAP